MLAKLSGTQGLPEIPALVYALAATQKEDSVRLSWNMQLVENTVLFSHPCAFLLNQPAAIASSALFAPFPPQKEQSDTQIH